MPIVSGFSCGFGGFNSSCQACIASTFIGWVYKHEPLESVSRSPSLSPLHLSLTEAGLWCLGKNRYPTQHLQTAANMVRSGAFTCDGFLPLLKQECFLSELLWVYPTMSLIPWLICARNWVRKNSFHFFKHDFFFFLKPYCVLCWFGDCFQSIVNSVSFRDIPEAERASPCSGRRIRVSEPGRNILGWSWFVNHRWDHARQE